MLSVPSLFCCMIDHTAIGGRFFTLSWSNQSSLLAGHRDKLVRAISFGFVPNIPTVTLCMSLWLGGHLLLSAVDLHLFCFLESFYIFTHPVISDYFLCVSLLTIFFPLLRPSFSYQDLVLIFRTPTYKIGINMWFHEITTFSWFH